MRCIPCFQLVTATKSLWLYNDRVEVRRGGKHQTELTRAKLQRRLQFLFSGVALPDHRSRPFQQASINDGLSPPLPLAQGYAASWSSRILLTASLNFGAFSVATSHTIS